MHEADISNVVSPAPRTKQRPAIGPRLRILFWGVLALLAILAANSFYLLGVTGLEAITGQTYENYFYQYMFLGHLLLGFLLILPVLVFAAIHWRNTYTRRHRRAAKIGYVLLAVTLTLLVTGVLLTRLGPFDLRAPAARSLAYWLHVLTPLAGGWLYWLHRLAGRPIRWRLGLGFGAAAGALAVGMILLHGIDPRPWFAKGPSEGEKYFLPSLARTASGKFIPAQMLMDDHYCLQCHADVHARWSDSVHHFSSFNNPVYLASVRETREFSKKQQGNVARARWCAGCHDPAPFFSGAFDDPNYDDVHDPTAQVGISCTACHAITNLNSTRGNADYTIEEPLHYPFATSDSPVLRWVNRQLIKAKPSFHKKTFLKPFHRSAEFCSACHKVHLPADLNDYKWLRGQNHYDTYLLSGVSGHGARSFYYPPKAKDRCADCHMPLKPSNDFGAQFFADAKELSVHDHLFPAANTGVAWLRDREDIIKAHQEFLQGTTRVDLFGIQQGATIDAPLTAPLRPNVPQLQPGQTYVLDVVIRTLKLGHPFTQGTVDSNEVWLDVTAESGGRVIGRSGSLDEHGEVDPWSHFVNVFMLDREGNRIDRRNPQDIFVPLYDNQIPPGAAATVHYGLTLPDREKLAGPIKVTVKLLYRKFDAKLMEFAAKTARPGDLPMRGRVPGEPYVDALPITVLCSDEITFSLEGIAKDAADAPTNPTPTNPVPKTPEWERWNDYGIGLLLKGKAELRQAADAFAAVERLKRFDGPLNLGRVYFVEGRLDEAVAALNRANQCSDPAPPPWTVAWLSGLVNRQQGHLVEAERNFRDVLEGRTPQMIERGFNFGLDYEVRNLLGDTLFDRAKQFSGGDNVDERKQLLRAAIEQFEKTLTLDSENAAAHYSLSLLFGQLGDEVQATEHREAYAKYKIDDNARDRAVAIAREKYPAANRAAERTAIYQLSEPKP